MEERGKKMPLLSLRRVTFMVLVSEELPFPVEKLLGRVDRVVLPCK